MIVQLNGRYAYLWNGRDDDIAVGDIVMVPPTWVDEVQGEYSLKKARVSAVNFETDYDGELTAIVSKVD
jgi:hypothetical protein